MSNEVTFSTYVPVHFEDEESFLGKLYQSCPRIYKQLPRAVVATSVIVGGVFGYLVCGDSSLLTRFTVSALPLLGSSIFLKSIFSVKKKFDCVDYIRKQKLEFSNGNVVVTGLKKHNIAICAVAEDFLGDDSEQYATIINIALSLFREYQVKIFVIDSVCQLKKAIENVHQNLKVDEKIKFLHFLSHGSRDKIFLNFFSTVHSGNVSQIPFHLFDPKSFIVLGGCSNGAEDLKHSCIAILVAKCAAPRIVFAARGVVSGRCDIEDVWSYCRVRLEVFQNVRDEAIIREGFTVAFQCLANDQILRKYSTSGFDLIEEQWFSGIESYGTNI